MPHCTVRQGLFFRACRPDRISLPIRSSGSGTVTNVTRPVSYAILEDYDKGQDLNDVALDFRMMNELGVDTWRGSFGWDDYEPERGNYDFTWLHEFMERADVYGIKLRPYLHLRRRGRPTAAATMAFTGTIRPGASGRAGLLGSAQRRTRFLRNSRLLVQACADAAGS